MADRRGRSGLLEGEDQIDAELTKLAISTNNETHKPIVQTAQIVDPNFRHFLIPIINQLDPASFVKFTRTCRDLNTFCFNTMEIRVPIGSPDQKKTFNLLVHKDQHGIEVELEEEHENGRPRPFPVELLEKLLEMPFRLEIQVATFWDDSEEDEDFTLAAAFEFLNRFSHPHIQKVVLSVNSVDWSTISAFLQKFHVAKLEITIETTPIPPDIFSFLSNYLTYFFYSNYVSDEVILAANSRDLVLGGATISTNTFTELIKKYISSDLDYWSIGRQRKPRNNNDPFSDEVPDPFLEACSEVLKTVTSEEEVSWENMEPCVLYTTFRFSWHFRFLKSNGAHARVVIFPHLVVFTRMI